MIQPLCPFWSPLDAQRSCASLSYHIFKLLYIRHCGLRREGWREAHAGASLSLCQYGTSTDAVVRSAPRTSRAEDEQPEMPFCGGGAAGGRCRSRRSPDQARYFPIRRRIGRCGRKYPEIGHRTSHPSCPHRIHQRHYPSTFINPPQPTLPNTTLAGPGHRQDA